MNREYPPLQPATLARARELAANPDRARLLEMMASAATREQIEQARSSQHAWLVKNPDDFGVLEAGERLAYIEEALDADIPVHARSEV